jgi:hypothetical protein
LFVVHFQGNRCRGKLTEINTAVAICSYYEKVWKR